MKSIIAASLAATLAMSVALPAHAQISNRTITVSNGIAEEHPVGDGVAAMRACYDEKTGGAWTLNAFWSSALGDDLQATQALRSGTQEMVVTSSSPIVGIVPALGVFDLPFLFANEAEADAILDGEFGDYISDMMPNMVSINLAFWENGSATSPTACARSRARGLRGHARARDANNIFLDTFQTLGTNALPMAFGEVFSALETRTIDARKTPT